MDRGARQATLHDEGSEREGKPLNRNAKPAHAKEP